MGNLKDALTDVKGLLKLHQGDYPRHFGQVDITEVVEFARIANEHNLTNKQYEKLIKDSEEYWKSIEQSKNF